MHTLRAGSSVPQFAKTASSSRSRPMKLVLVVKPRSSAVAFNPRCSRKAETPTRRLARSSVNAVGGSSSIATVVGSDALETMCWAETASPSSVTTPVTPWASVKRSTPVLKSTSPRFEERVEDGGRHRLGSALDVRWAELDVREEDQRPVLEGHPARWHAGVGPVDAEDVLQSRIVEVLVEHGLERSESVREQHVAELICGKSAHRGDLPDRDVADQIEELLQPRSVPGKGCLQGVHDLAPTHRNDDVVAARHDRSVELVLANELDLVGHADPVELLEQGTGLSVEADARELVQRHLELESSAPERGAGPPGDVVTLEEKRPQSTPLQRGGRHQAGVAGTDHDRVVVPHRTAIVIAGSIPARSAIGHL